MLACIVVQWSSPTCVSAAHDRMLDLLVTSSKVAGQTWRHKAVAGAHPVLFAVQGTSMACPHVAGTVALIISQAKAAKLTLDTAQILAILQDTATPLKCPAAEPYVPYVRHCAQPQCALISSFRSCMSGPASGCDPTSESGFVPLIFA